MVHVAQLKGLLAASDLHDRALVQESRDHFLELEIEHELRTEAWPPGFASEDRLRDGLKDFRH